ncbi:MAG: pantetheine-phosphate adenylyltransferase [Firmicutes bacterium]|nr:pantetheine-phosphate adenylyltransferase [Bacillota bacterium]
MSKTAVYAGSFDPITNGHLNIIRRAAKMYDSLTVAVIVNVSKRPFFSIEERVDIIKKVTADIPNVKVECFSGLLADYVNANRFSVVIRGLRATSDFENEIQMAQMNARLYTEGTETVFLMTDPRYSFISSSMIKEVATLGGSVTGLVDEYTESIIKTKIKG